MRNRKSEKDEINIDIIDLSILEHLRNNSRKPIVRIADELCISEATVRSRINKLRENGILKEYTIIKGQGVGFKVIISFKVHLYYIDEASNKLRNFRKIDSVFHTTGEQNILVIGNFKDSNDFMEFMREHIYTLKGVRNIKTFMIDRSHKDEYIPKLI